MEAWEQTEKEGSERWLAAATCKPPLPEEEEKQRLS
jgi:hypothetical protein